MMTVIAKLAEAVGGIHVAGLTEDSIDAAALWFPPGYDFIPTPESGWFEVVAKVTQDSPEVAEWWGTLFAAEHEIVEPLYGATAEKDSWYLWSIGVDPKLERHGLGSALMQYAISKADSMGNIVLVEGGSAGAKFYEKNGLTQVGAIDAQSPKGPSWTQVVLTYVPPARGA
ncbi:hypothetical protein EXIGLDRAFT_730388 [Exidia glandulosa HHB12029]|uniref:N-acetyltransferase domain-containing protein n=1 Tax=Exidia glandulosa HHB12029 TaxID=1314781 RepID=A0A165C6Q2_EXIGL|nr:hypothetical protein EXIGLDRAFT_730388 [Exidia glandulosa HHB12029]